MNAVAEKPQARRKAGAVASSSAATPAAHQSAPTFEECCALFRMASQALHEASRTDEPHEFSGESDRLLRIGADIALQASKANKEEHESATYDVAACINAARLVPGDTESAARTAFIATAAAALSQVTGDTPEQIVFTDLKRPKSEGGTALRRRKRRSRTRISMRCAGWDAQKLCWSFMHSMRTATWCPASAIWSPCTTKNPKQKAMRWGLAQEAT